MGSVLNFLRVGIGERPRDVGVFSYDPNSPEQSMLGRVRTLAHGVSEITTQVVKLELEANAEDTKSRNMRHVAEVVPLVVANPDIANSSGVDTPADARATAKAPVGGAEVIDIASIRRIIAEKAIPTGTRTIQNGSPVAKEVLESIAA